ncbi:MAG: ribose 5-phosphate isomerase B [Bacteroidetes bacterium GWA2_31_9b]|nr:MAG: ribose 5-phosphate isomerase B [Bacteroidetes bacterium GWA2_31_9b]
MENKQLNIKLAIACDHAGFDFKEDIKTYLEKKGYIIKDFGTYSNESTDYPDYAHPLAEAVEKGNYLFGITLCGSGNGINMTANKHQGIRAALCWNVEISELARLHNNANVCSIPARFVNIDLAKKIIDIFLTTKFEGGRHLQRIEKIPVKK